MWWFFTFFLIHFQVYFGQNVACECPEPSDYGGVPALKVGDVLNVTKTASVAEIML